MTLLLSNANDDDLRFSPLFDIIIKFFYLCVYIYIYANDLIDSIIGI